MRHWPTFIDTISFLLISFPHNLRKGVLDNLWVPFILMYLATVEPLRPISRPTVATFANYKNIVYINYNIIVYKN